MVAQNIVVEGKVVVQIEWKDLKEAAADLNKESLC
jgi:hypothetical protein